MAGCLFGSSSQENLLNGQPAMYANDNEVDTGRAGESDHNHVWDVMPPAYRLAAMSKSE